MGRRTMLTPPMHERIISLLQSGFFRTSVCKSVGIAPSTLKDWIARGNREKSGIYHDFAREVADIERQLEGSVLARVFEAANKGDEKAAIAFLSRRFPDRWHEHPTLEPIMNGEGMSLAGKAKAIADLMTAGEISPEQARTAAAALREIAQVIDLDEIADQVRQLSKDQQETLRIRHDYNSKPD